MEYKLNEIFDSISVKHKFNNDEIIFLNTSDILDGDILNHEYTSVKNLPGQAKKTIKKNDILYSEIRPQNKRFAKVEIDTENYVVSTKLMVLRLKKEMKKKILLDYIYLIITSENFIKNLQAIAESRSGTFPQITFKEFGSITVDIPTLNEQHVFINIFGGITEKIKNNKNSIKNLEQISQTLFKRWFIDFEFPDEEGQPYKSSGGRMVESELGEIPKGWRIGSITDFGQVIGGGTPSKKVSKYYSNNDIPWITPKDLSQNKNMYIYRGNTDITKLGLEKSSTKILSKHSILYSSRAPIGYIAIAGVDLTTNQGFKSIMPSEVHYTFFVYELMKNLTNKIISVSSGSTFKEISSSGLKSIKISVPEENIIVNYNKQVSKNFELIKVLELENNNLEQLRDTLLPKLLSGEIEIPDELEV